MVAWLNPIKYWGSTDLYLCINKLFTEQLVYARLYGRYYGEWVVSVPKKFSVYWEELAYLYNETTIKGICVQHFIIY